MKYKSTRNFGDEVSASEAIFKSISNGGGLYVPSSFPVLDKTIISELIELDFAQRVAKVLEMYIDDIPYQDLLKCCQNAMEKFEDSIVKVEDGLFMLELWHSASHTCKDISLCVLGEVLSVLTKKQNKSMLCVDVVDKDVARLKAYENVKNAQVLVLYPYEDMSKITRNLLLLDEGGNVQKVAVKATVKDMHKQVKIALDNMRANHEDIFVCENENANVLRVLTMMGCFVSAYCDLVDGGEIELGEKVNFALPTAHFTNAIALYYLKRMGLPINKVVLATNANNALQTFFNEGRYCLDREFFHTMSKSLDVYGCDGLERLVFDLVGRDCDKVKTLYDSLSANGAFDVELGDFTFMECGWADEEDTKQTIFTFFDLDDYIMDPNTAVGASVYNDYSCDTDDETTSIIISTENPYLHSVEVLSALGTREKNEQKAVWKLQNATALECPNELTFEVECEDEDVIALSNIQNRIEQMINA